MVSLKHVFLVALALGASFAYGQSEEEKTLLTKLKLSKVGKQGPPGPPGPPGGNVTVVSAFCPGGPTLEVTAYTSETPPTNPCFVPGAGESPDPGCFGTCPAGSTIIGAECVCAGPGPNGAGTEFLPGFLVPGDTSIVDILDTVPTTPVSTFTFGVAAQAECRCPNAVTTGYVVAYCCPNVARRRALSLK